MRIAVAAILALAVAVLPVMLDRCAESCDAHQHTVASTPACHHASTTGPQLSQPPSACGHDHSATTVTTARGFLQTGRAFDSIVAFDMQPMVAPPAAAGVRVGPHSPPHLAATLDRRPVPLRV